MDYLIVYLKEFSKLITIENIEHAIKYIQNLSNENITVIPLPSKAVEKVELLKGE